MKRAPLFIVIASLVFTIASFAPSLYDVYYAGRIPSERLHLLEHNYLFDYNFYLSRIRQGIEGRWMVTEKYYNHSHPVSLFQILYLYFGKVGAVLNLEPPVLYHASRFIFGFIFLLVIGWYSLRLFTGQVKWGLIAFLLIITAGSWPIPVQLDGGGWRLATYMGWWSVVDSLQRITTLPHILVGQIGLTLFVWRLGYVGAQNIAPLRSVFWGILGLIVGIIFPPTLIIVYCQLFILSLMELVTIGIKRKFHVPVADVKKWMRERGIPRTFLLLLSMPALAYMQYMFRFMPWSALPLFDVQHRIPLPYTDYLFALGPVLPLGILGFILTLVFREKKLYPAVSWVLAIGLLFLVFEYVPTQSPLRFTEGAVHIPLGILTAYLFYRLFHMCDLGNLGHLGKAVRSLAVFLVSAVIVLGVSVMASMILWLTDQVRAKAAGTFTVPIGAELAYPLREFMDGVYFLRDHTNREDVVLTYVTAGNYIPAYAGNPVYIGHANTPDEDGKEKIAARFFKGEMTVDEANDFLKNERVSYVYFGPQEKALGSMDNLPAQYPMLSEIYKNTRVTILKIR